jgi:hypothetical protein
MKRLGLWIVGIVVLALAAIAFTSHAQKKQGVQAQSDRLQKAEALFAERCKTAGEKIYRVVEDVEGIYLLKLRPSQPNHANQFALDDPYGKDFGGDAYIKNFIRGFWDESRPKQPNRNTPPRIGYSYVEAVDPADGKRYRYTGRIEEPWRYDKSFLQGYTRFVMDKAPATGEPPRYGVTYDDISTREEREYWIAGSSLKVIDLQTNEVVAERVGYMMDRGQGNDAGGRAPWLWAADSACPSFALKRGFTAQSGQAEKFVGKVLHPKIEK